MGSGSGSKKQLGKIMLQQKLVTQTQLQEMLEDQRRDGMRLASTAARAGRVTVSDALNALAEQHGVPAADLTRMVVPLAPLRLIPRELAVERVVFPLGVEGDQLRLAMASPSDPEVMQELQFVAAKTIVPHVALDHVLRQVIDFAYDRLDAGDSYYVGPLATDAQIAEIGITDHPRAVLDLSEPKLEAPPEPTPEATPEPAANAAPDLEVDGEAPAHEPSPRERALSNAPPLDEAFAERTVPSQPPLLPVHDASARVLLAGWNEGLRAEMRHALEQSGITVFDAADGLSAMQVVRDEAPKVIVLELGLREIDGFDVCRRLRGSERYVETPIIVISGETEGWRLEQDLRDAYGVEHVFRRGCDREKLTRTIRLVLDGQCVNDDPPALSQASEECWCNAMDAFESGDLEGAIEQLRVGSQRDPGAFELHYHLGLLHGRKDALFAAIRSLERAIELHPKHFSALKNLAVVYQRAGFRHKSLDAWERALEAAPNDETRTSIKEHMVSLL